MDTEVKIQTHSERNERKKNNNRNVRKAHNEKWQTKNKSDRM